MNKNLLLLTNHDVYLYYSAVGRLGHNTLGTP